MVCDCLVLVGATAKTSWSEVASYLTHYLTHHPDQRPHLLVCLSSIIITPRCLDFCISLSLSLQLPFSAVLQEVHRGEWSSPQRQSFISSVLPSLLEQVWALHSPHALWLAYRLARRASAKVAPPPPPPHTHTHEIDSIMEFIFSICTSSWNFNPCFSLNILSQGYHELAGPVYQRLSQSVTLARFRRWLSALHHFSSSQLLLSPSPPSSHLIPALGNAAALVSKAAMLIKVQLIASIF